LQRRAATLTPIPVPKSLPRAMAPRETMHWLRSAALAALVGYWLALAASTHWPASNRLLGLGPYDKPIHLAAYLILAVLLCANAALRRPLAWRHYVTIWAMLAAYGALDEITQIPVGRIASVGDWIADMVGALLGVGLFAAAAAWLRSRVAPTPERSSP
jgi:hypothetical protein